MSSFGCEDWHFMLGYDCRVRLCVWVGQDSILCLGFRGFGPGDQSCKPQESGRRARGG